MAEDTPESSSFKPKTFKEAISYARKSRPSVSQENVFLTRQPLPVPQEMFAYIFNLQGQIEQGGPMDYHKYSRAMWRQLTGEVEINSKGFEIFEQSLIAGLHNIDMKDLVYPELSQNLAELAEEYKNDIKTISIWSMGDVSATGYQLGKVDRSRIIQDFLAATRRKFPRDERARFIRERTAYLVDDNKFDKLVEYTGQVIEAHPGERVKIVIIEDNAGNFDKARKALEDKFGAGKVEIVPIWFTGSREGISAERKVEELRLDGSEKYQEEKEALEKKKRDFNAMPSFEELLNSDRFRPLLQGSHVMVDFDGVICDNVKMRELQASIIYNSLLASMSLQRGISPEEAEELVNSKLNSRKDGK